MSMINGTIYTPNNFRGPHPEPVAFPRFQGSPSSISIEEYYHRALGVDGGLYTPIPELLDETVVESRAQGPENLRGQDCRHTSIADGGLRVQNPGRPKEPPTTRPDSPLAPRTPLRELAPLVSNVGSLSNRKTTWVVSLGRRVKLFCTPGPSRKSASSDRPLISWPSNFTHEEGNSDLTFLTNRSSSTSSTRTSESTDRSHGDASRTGCRRDRTGAENLPSQSRPIQIVISSEPELPQGYSPPSSSHCPKSRS